MTTIETIEVTPTCRIRVVVDEDASNPRDDWDMMTGFVKIRGRGSLNRLDVPPVHEDYAGIGEAQSRLEDEDDVVRWARIFHGMHIEYDAEHGGYWFVDPTQMRLNFPATMTGRVRYMVANPLAPASRWKVEPRYYHTYADTLEVQAQVIEQEQETYRQWAEGEVVGVIVERQVHEHTVSTHHDGTVTESDTTRWEMVESVWGNYLSDDYTAQDVASEMGVFTDAELEALHQ